MTAMRAPATTVAAPRHMRLAIIALRRPAVVACHAVAVEPGQHGGEEKEDAVHDAEGEAGLEHGARLVGVDGDAVAVEGAEDAKVDVVGRAGRDVGAVGVGDEAEVVDACNEGADEACGREGRFVC